MYGFDGMYYGLYDGYGGYGYGGYGYGGYGYGSFPYGYGYGRGRRCGSFGCRGRRYW